MPDASADRRRAMRALTLTGHYTEDLNSFEWLTMEAADCAHLIATYPDRAVEEVFALLADTGLHDIEDPAEAACLQRDAESVVAAVNRA